MGFGWIACHRNWDDRHAFGAGLGGYASAASNLAGFGGSELSGERFRAGPALSIGRLPMESLGGVGGSWRITGIRRGDIRQSCSMVSFNDCGNDSARGRGHFFQMQHGPLDRLDSCNRGERWHYLRQSIFQLRSATDVGLCVGLIPAQPGGSDRPSASTTKSLDPCRGQRPDFPSDRCGLRLASPASMTTN